MAKKPKPPLIPPGADDDFIIRALMENPGFVFTRNQETGAIEFESRDDVDRRIAKMGDSAHHARRAQELAAEVAESRLAPRRHGKKGGDKHARPDVHEFVLATATRMRTANIDVPQSKIVDECMRTWTGKMILSLGSVQKWLGELHRAHKIPRH